MKYFKSFEIVIVGLILMSSCSISYKFNGTVIDYDKIKSISIVDFTNQASMVYAPLTAKFNEELKDIYTRQTRLNLISRNADLELDGEIVGYDITPMSLSTNSLASETRLTIKINVRYINNTNHEEDFEKVYSAYRNFDSERLLTDVQDELIEEITKEICENIYNDTVANW
ncbi:MAG: hypothetical protein EOL95_06485 [Bacteroidia bacterium]|nr:hypothetical protein [Bacteroidia bacterium]